MSRGQPAVTPHRAHGRAQPHPALSIAVLTAVAGLLVLVLLAATLALRLPARGVTEAHGGLRAARTAPPVLLTLRPRTVTQVAHIGALRIELTAGPLVPGPNRLVVILVENGRGVHGAHLRVQATMVGMLMRPVVRVAMDRGRGRYGAAVPLSMFGTWDLSVYVERRPHASLAHLFVLNLDLPAGAAAVVGLE